MPSRWKYDRPMSRAAFEARFPDEASCARHLAAKRWPDGFVCPACGHDRGWELKRRRASWECAACGKETSVTAGTIMHRSHLPLKTWFMAVHIVTSHSNGISALQLQAQLGLGSYKSAWLLLHKLRRAMVDPDRSLLEDLVEIDEATLPFRTVKDPTTGGQGRSRQGKMRIAGAVELSPEGEPRRIRLAPIGDFSARSLHAFVAGTSAPGARVITDGWSGYPGLPDHDHQPKVVGATPAHPSRADLDPSCVLEPEALHARAGKYRRVVMLKTAHALREEKARKQDEGRVHPAPSERPVVVETMLGTTPTAPVTRPDTPAQAHPDPTEAARQDAREAYEALNRDWDRHLARADRAGIHAIYVDGGERFRARMEALAGNPDLDPALQEKVSRVLAIIDEETALRREVEDYLAAVEARIEYRNNVLEIVAIELRNEVADHHGYSEWREEIEGLAETGQRILADRERYGDHLEGVPAGGERMEWALEEIRETLTKDDRHLAESRERGRKREQAEKRGQTKEQSRKTAKRKRKSRYQSRGLRM